MLEIRPPWKYEKPLCAEIGTEFFFTEEKDEKSGTERFSVYEDARKTCSLCSHQSECANWAIKNEKFGFWGGLSAVERKMLRRKLNIRLGEDLDIEAAS